MFVTVFYEKKKKYDIIKQDCIQPDYISNCNVELLADPGEARDCSTNSLVIHSLIQWVLKPFLPTFLRRRHAKTVRGSSSSYKTDYVIVIKKQLSKYWRVSKSHQWFNSYGHFTEGMDLAYWWSCIGKGLCLQPAQKACFKGTVYQGSEQHQMSYFSVFLYGIFLLIFLPLLFIEISFHISEPKSLPHFKGQFFL